MQTVMINGVPYVLVPVENKTFEPVHRETSGAGDTLLTLLGGMMLLVVFGGELLTSLLNLFG